MTDVYLIRHATYNDIVHGVSIENPGLSAEGIRQAERLRERLTRTREITADVVISSPLRRAIETAEILAPALSQPIMLEKELEEWQCDDAA